MSLLRFYTDEDIYAAVAVDLRKAGFDAVSTVDAGRLGESDESQLHWAAAQGRVLVTFNVRDFAVLHAQWLDQSLHHSGVIVSNQRPIGEMIGRIIKLAQTLDAMSLVDRLEFLSDW